MGVSEEVSNLVKQHFQISILGDTHNAYNLAPFKICYSGLNLPVSISRR